MEERTYHKIWLLRKDNNGRIYYSMHYCFNVDFYTRAIEAEFRIHETEVIQ